MRSVVAPADAATVLAPVVRRLAGDPPLVRLRFWDGSRLGPDDAPCTIVVRSPMALRRMLWAPGELGICRAYVAGDLDVEGDMFALLATRDRVAAAGEYHAAGLRPGDVAGVLRGLYRELLGPPPPPPPEEARLQGRHHARSRDRAAVAHHYDVGNGFYRLLLGPSLTYSCAHWADPERSLEQAQTSKYELVCRKLGLEPGLRLLDVGCGWGGMAMHAAEAHGVDVVGITLSVEQYELARQRVEEAGLAGRVEIRLQDYRDVVDGPFDAISSIGMFEHVGDARTRDYLDRLHGLLGPRGRLLNHAISEPPGMAPIAPRSFTRRYVFPDGEVLEVGRVVSAAQAAGLEVRDVESLREHYALTLRAWSANLDAHWDEAVRLAGSARARIWRLYLAGCAVAFEQARLSIHQVLAVRADPDGASGLPLDRAELLKLKEAPPAPAYARAS